MRNTLYAYGPLAVICLALAGCGGGNTPGTSASSANAEIDACSLLTAAEIEATMGVAPGKPERPNAGVHSCQWPNPDSPHPVAYIGLSAHNAASWEEYREGMLTYDLGDPNTQGERIDIGRFGHYQKDVALIQVQTDRGLLITLNARGSSKTQIIDLASKALAHLR